MHVCLRCCFPSLLCVNHNQSYKLYIQFIRLYMVWQCLYNCLLNQYFAVSCLHCAYTPFILFTGFKHFHSGYLSVTKQEQTKDGFINVTIVLHINRSAANGDTAINHYYLTWGYGTQSLSLEGRSIARIGYTIQLDAVSHYNLSY